MDKKTGDKKLLQLRKFFAEVDSYKDNSWIKYKNVLTDGDDLENSEFVNCSLLKVSFEKPDLSPSDYEFAEDNGGQKMLDLARETLRKFYFKEVLVKNDQGDIQRY